MIGLVVVLGVIASVLFCIFLCNMFKIQELNDLVYKLKSEIWDLKNLYPTKEYLKSRADSLAYENNDLRKSYLDLEHKYIIAKKNLKEINNLSTEFVSGVVEVPDTENGTNRN